MPDSQTRTSALVAAAVASFGGAGSKLDARSFGRGTGRLRRVRRSGAIAIDQLPAGVADADNERNERDCANSGKNARDSTGDSADETCQRDDDDHRGACEEPLSHLLVRLDGLLGYDPLDSLAFCAAGLNREIRAQSQSG